MGKSKNVYLQHQEETFDELEFLTNLENKTINKKMSLINISINLDKIPKEKIIKGEKGKYLNISVMEKKDGADQYGNTHYTIISQTKEERQNKVDKIYLGNEKVFNFDNNNNNNLGGNDFKSDGDDDDLPF